MCKFSVISAISFVLLMSACNHSKSVSNDWHAGGLYSTADGKGQFSVVKILVLEPNAVHVRVYKQRFSSRPTSIDPGSLTVGQLDGKDSFSIGHLPLSRASFASWAPVFITQQPVSDDELEGYKMWKEAKGGVFQLRGARKGKSQIDFSTWLLFMPATTYSPTHFRVQYNRPSGA